MIVELKRAGVPYFGILAVHYWFVTNTSGKRERFEVWQHAHVRTPSIGHLHRNLMRPDANVGGGPTEHVRQWDGAEAERIVRALKESWHEYPYRHHYRALPGPNSNTYVAWILRRAGIPHTLSWRGIGKKYRAQHSPPL